MSHIYEDEVEPGKFNPKAGASFLRGLDADDKRALMGVDGAKEFNASPGKWGDLVRGFEGFKPINNLMAD